MTSSRMTDSVVMTGALEWAVELEDQGMDPLSPYPTMNAKLQAFAQWFLESPHHQDAFIEALAISGVSRRFDLQHRINVEHLKSAPDSNVIRFTGETAARRQPEAQRLRALPRRKRFFVAACACLLVLLAAPLLFLSLRSSPQVSSLSTRYSAGIGERLFVPLEDGSTLELNTRSSVEVEITPHTRRVILLAGEAVFNVRHDETRPFTVVSGELVIRDVGTTFAVRQLSGETTVSVLEGRIALSMTEAGRIDIPSTIVDAEHRAAITIHGKHVDLQVEPVTPAELARALAWRDGRLVFNGETLGQIATEFNRYNRRQIKIVDPSLARVTVGGTFSTTDFDGFLATLRYLFHVHTTPVTGNANTLEMKRQESQ